MSAKITVEVADARILGTVPDVKTLLLNLKAWAEARLAVHDTDASVKMDPNSIKRIVDTVGALTVERDGLLAEIANQYRCIESHAAITIKAEERADAVESILTAARAERDALRAALEPFAHYTITSVHMDANAVDGFIIRVIWANAGPDGNQPMFAHFDAARAALSRPISEKDDQ